MGLADGRRATLALGSTACCVLALLAAPAAALAHGFGGRRADLPISKTLFIYAAALVLILSFVALAVLWPRPKLAGYRFIPLPLAVSRVLLSRPVAVLLGAVGVFLLELTIYAGLTGVQTSSANFAPTVARLDRAFAGGAGSLDELAAEAAGR